MKILFAADGSEYTERAAHFLVSHLAWFRVAPELHLLHVKLPIPQGMALTRAQAVLGDDAIEAYYAEQANEAVATARAILSAADIVFETGWRVGDIAQEINRYATEHAIEMIVMGSHGHGALRNLVLGSVATKVLASDTGIPVLIVR
ncbi:universal stress protein [Actimicrobium antarcticum]|uniref:Universal stress protein n=1 Tax=Actimicrobium antarcticum TaxID=1051899 RepID=A0ABP7SPW4_9BURK